MEEGRTAVEERVTSEPAQLQPARLRARLRAHVGDVVALRCAEYVRDVEGAAFLAGVLSEFVDGGKYLRSTFAYLGWRCAAADDEAAVRACAGLELLHAFALLQDDVMDGSLRRRGREAVHVQLARWHRQLGRTGSAERFGKSGAVLLADLCLVWAEQALRESGLPAPALERAWPRYDAMRSELAVGQFADLLNDTRRDPSWPEVLDVIRRKSGNYTVRRPLELGAALAGADAGTQAVLAEYGTVVGEAFQLRDDVLGVFGSTSTGKPVTDDLDERKATSIVVLARQMADPAARAHLDGLLAGAPGEAVDAPACREAIEATGARGRAEELIAARVSRALRLLDHADIAAPVAEVLRHMAARCADRDR